jgi:hypothetical protein
MKKLNMTAAAGAAITAVAWFGLALAGAEELKIDFDGRKGADFISAADLRKEGPAAGPQTPAPTPVQPAVKTEITVKAIMRVGEKSKIEVLSCLPGQNGDKITECKKSDSSALNHQDVGALSLRKYFSEETLKFSDLMNQAKHSYTNQSGPMTFACDDACGNYDLVSIGLSPFFPYLESFEVQCVEWTHECECVEGCS